MSDGIYSASPPAPTDGYRFPLQLDSAGNLKVNVAAGGAGGGGGAATVADGADVTQGAKADAAWSGSGSGSIVAILKAISAGTATQATLAAVLAKLSADPATQTTLAAVVTALGGTLNVAGQPSVVATATFTRPADTTAYAAGDLVANSVTAGSVVPLTFSAARLNGGTGSLVRARLSTSHTGLLGTETFTLELFKNSPTAANGDNGVYSVNGIAAVSLGIFNITLDRVYTDGSKGFAVPVVGSQIIYDAAAGSKNLYGLLKATTAYTPVSGETFTVALEELVD